MEEVGRSAGSIDIIVNSAGRKAGGEGLGLKILKILRGGGVLVVGRNVRVDCGSVDDRLDCEKIDCDKISCRSSRLIDGNAKYKV